MLPKEYSPVKASILIVHGTCQAAARALVLS